jgi:hypothetical protein
MSTSATASSSFSTNDTLQRDPPRSTSHSSREQQITSQRIAEAQRDLLFIQARCKVAGQNMDAEFERVRSTLNRFGHLLRDLSEADDQ